MEAPSWRRPTSATRRAPHDATLVALCNSPSVGVGYYDNTHDELEAEKFSHNR